ncbi:MAG: hypothetical protein ACN4GM_06175 [Gammaproteobacteria bacterium]
MKYHKIIAVCLILLPGAVSAGNFGIGVSLKSSDSAIYFPYKLNETLIFEPYISQRSNKVTNVDSTINYTQTLIGFGLLANKSVYEKTHVYYGVRLAYIKDKNTIEANFNILSPNNGSTSGYQVEPLIGISYNVTNNIALRGEAALFYNKRDGEEFNTVSNQNQDIEKTENGTITRILLSYYF